MKTLTKAVALAVALLLSQPLASHAASSSRACQKDCGKAKKTCLDQVHAALKQEQDKCTGTKAQVRQCRKDAKAASKGDKAACGTFFKTCKSCCQSGGSARSARRGDGPVNGPQQC